MQGPEEATLAPSSDQNMRTTQRHENSLHQLKENHQNPGHLQSTNETSKSMGPATDARGAEVYYEGIETNTALIVEPGLKNCSKRTLKRRSDSKMLRTDVQGQ